MFPGLGPPAGGATASEAVSGDRRMLALGVAVLCVVCFLWAAEYPLAQFWQGLGHGTSLLVASIAVLSVRGATIPNRGGDWRWFGASCLSYLAIGFAPLAVSAAAGLDSRFALQQLAFGHLAPIAFVAAALTLPAREQQRLWNAFYFGWVVFLAVSIVVLAASWQTAAALLPQFESAGFAGRLILWRFTLGLPWNDYGHLMGNANKLSNNVLMFLLMSVTLLSLERANRPRRVLLWAFWLLGIFTLVVMFSRAAILLLPVAVLASGIMKEVPRRARRVLFLGAAAGLAGLWLAAPEIFEYLLGARLLPGADADPLGTYNDRLAQWSELLDFLSSHTSAFLFGLGTTGYGLRFIGTPEAGTHNTFLDLSAEAGIVGPLLLGATLVGIVMQVLVGVKSARRRIVMTAGLGSLLLLMTREHSFSYLYVTSLGGLCLAVLLYAAMAPDPDAPDPQASGAGGLAETARPAGSAIAGAGARS